MGLTRRQLLKYGAGGAALLALGGIGLSLQRTITRTPRAELAALSEREFSILAAVADRIAPGGDGFPSAWDAHVPEKLDALFATMHPGAVDELKQALALLENAAAGLLLDGRTSTFTGSSGDEQDDILQAWRTSNLQVRRTAFKALNGLIGATYWSSSDVFAAIGYPGPLALNAAADEDPT